MRCFREDHCGQRRSWLAGRPVEVQLELVAGGSERGHIARGLNDPPLLLLLSTATLCCYCPLLLSAATVHCYSLLVLVLAEDSFILIVSARNPVERNVFTPLRLGDPSPLPFTIEDRLCWNMYYATECVV